MTDFSVTIYHNPKCGTSRNTVAMVEQAGYSPIVVEYLSQGWSLELLKSLLVKLNMSARDIMREKGTPAQELGLLDEGVSEEAILNAMTTHPILVNRPIVVTPKGAVLARPSQIVAQVLDKPIGDFTKEDGEIIKA